MNRILKTCFQFAVAATLLIGIASAWADDAPAHAAVGSISGIVTDSKGAPQPNVTVNLWPPSPIKVRSPKSAAIGGEVVAKSKKAPADNGGGNNTPKKKGPEPIMTTITANDGSYSLASIPVGDYSIEAGKKDGSGYAKQMVSVREGQVVNGDLHLGAVGK